MKMKWTIILMLLGLTFAIASLNLTDALNQNSLFRSIGAKVASDDTALLKLEGFLNPSLVVSNVNRKYFYVGSITNNYSHSMHVIVGITPNFSKLTNKNYWLGINIGNSVTEFTATSAPMLQTVHTLGPGEKLDVQVALTGNQAREVTVSYSFSATDSLETFSMHLMDTATNPRRMTLK